jgi:Ser/Thr protein kinase RdoA (MazF antagonist)
MSYVVQAAESFTGPGATISQVEEEYGQGIIHDTYLVKVNNGACRFILQRINKEVFADPGVIMHNLQVIYQHVQAEKERAGRQVDANWQMMHGLTTRDGRDFFSDADGGFWRALSFIGGAIPLTRISCLQDAREAGHALGTFHRLVSTLDPALLQATLPGFHNIIQYLEKYDTASGRDQGIAEPERYCRKFVECRRDWAPVLEYGRRENLLRVRVIHGDPKINNIMVSWTTGKAVSMIDLDTVMPGLVQYDIGDCLRSCCNTMGEEAHDLSGVCFDPQRCAAVLSGYTAAARGFLTGPDFDFFFDAIRLIPFELGLRFYTDFLEGNTYFKVSRRDQNLHRALVQFKLVESIEEQEERIREIIAGCRSCCMPVTR